MPRRFFLLKMQIFKFSVNRRTIVYTVLTFVVFVAVAFALLQFYVGGFFSAWFISLVLAIIALMVLSIPRSMVVTEETLEIRCVSDITVLEIKEIASVRLLTQHDMKQVIPLFGAIGFFGYYGKFFDLKELETITIYASEWDNFVEITDIYDYRTIVSCRDREVFMAIIEKSVANKELLEESSIEPSEE